MRTFLQKVPFPLSGLMLGCVSLGNLLNGNSFLMTIATLFILLLTGKLLLCFKDCLIQIKNPITASICGTYSMSLMLLSVYYQDLLGKAAFIIWIAAIALHLVIMFYFTYKILPQVRPSQFHATFFIPYVGIAVATLTAPAYQAQSLGQFFWYIALVSFIILAVLMAYRYLVHGKRNPIHLKPLVGVFAAPASLCLAAYLQSFAQPSLVVVVSLLLVSMLIYTWVTLQIPRLIKKEFYPTYAALTFPLVISATASTKAAALLPQMTFLKYWAILQTAIACCMVIYVLALFIVLLINLSQWSKSLDQQSLLKVNHLSFLKNHN